MPALKRKKAPLPSRTRNPGESLLKPEQQTEPQANPDLRAVIRLCERAARDYSRLVDILSRRARHARKKGHPIEAAILDRIASLLMSWKTLDECGRNFKIVEKLVSWLPLADEVRGLTPKERKAWAIMFVRKQGFDPQTREQLTRQMTQKPGVPQTTRRLAIHALESRREGKGWDEIAKSLPCDWTMVDDPGNAIRRQVHFLEHALKEFGVSLESI